jgi:TetR/AcrR family transcriptional regulator, transcriptional repressor for nem operon
MSSAVHREVEMKVSREQVADNRRKILDAASRLFRARGFDAVSVAEVMKAAGLTHGGFYGYFKSKDDLIAHALSHALEAPKAKRIDLAEVVSDYLSSQHRADIEGGCPTAALASEVIRRSPDARAAMTAGLRRNLERLSAIAPGEDDARKRRNAVGSWASMVGAIVLARLSDDAALSDEILEQTRAWIDEGGSGPSRPS